MESIRTGPKSDHQRRRAPTATGASSANGTERGVVRGDREENRQVAEVCSEPLPESTDPLSSDNLSLKYVLETSLFRVSEARWTGPSSAECAVEFYGLKDDYLPNYARRFRWAAAGCAVSVALLACAMYWIVTTPSVLATAVAFQLPFSSTVDGAGELIVGESQVPELRRGDVVCSIDGRSLRLSSDQVPAYRSVFHATSLLQVVRGKDTFLVRIHNKAGSAVSVDNVVDGPQAYWGTYSSERRQAASASDGNDAQAIERRNDSRRRRADVLARRKRSTVD